MTGLPAMELSQIPMSPALAATLARASDGARATGAGEVSLEHLLASLCDDPDAADVLFASQVDVGRLKSEVYGYLNRAIPQGMAPPRDLILSIQLRKILEAAAAAARGGRRRDINGAIVLAAIVGDGKSAAAQMLQARGLTFDEAIRALQSALAQPPRDANSGAGAAADDVLARARERVQSRSAPTLREIMQDVPRPAAAVAPPPPQQMPQSLPGVDDLPQEPVAMNGPRGPEATAAAPRIEESKVVVLGANEAQSRVPPSVEREPERPAPPLSSPAAGSDVFAPASQPREQANPVATPSDGYAYPTAQPVPRALEPTLSAPSVPERPTDFDDTRRFEAAAYVPAPRQHTQVGPPPIPPPIPRAQPHVRQPASYPQSYGAPQMLPGGPPAGMPNGGSLGGPMGPPMGARPPMPMPAPQRAPERGAAQSRATDSKAEIGPLAENVPRSMRVGNSERVEIRIARARAKAITEGMEGGGLAWRHDVTITKAMSVRLRAPEGGFFIETASPETQWIDSQFGDIADDFASWRFLVTPNKRGWSSLQIIVSARTIGADGLAAETAFPDQVVEVKVRTNYKRAMLRWSGWIVAAVAGGAFAKFGEGAFEAGSALVAKFLN